MNFDSLCNLIFNELVLKLRNNEGVFIFAKERAKFEGWLKVELCGILSKYFPDVVPERDRIDITFDDWAIELKTINTNYRFKKEGVMNKTRPITRNVEGVINDVKKLKSTHYNNKAVLFVVFPVIPSHKDWERHLEKISSHLRKLQFKKFKFRNSIPGVIYLGYV